MPGTTVKVSIGCPVATSVTVPGFATDWPARASGWAPCPSARSSSWHHDTLPCSPPRRPGRRGAVPSESAFRVGPAARRIQGLGPPHRATRPYAPATGRPCRIDDPSPDRPARAEPELERREAVAHLHGPRLGGVAGGLDGQEAVAPAALPKAEHAIGPSSSRPDSRIGRRVGRKPR